MTEFDWVTARSNCSLVAIFEGLKTQLQEDVTKRKEQTKDDGYNIVLHGTRVSVTHTMDYGISRDAVIFVLTQVAIEVHDRQDKLKFKATPTLNEKGECRLKVDGKEIELWHFRKLALEDLFFG
jgi:hypothetical protein